MLFWIFVAITAAFVIWGIIDDWYNEGIFIGVAASGIISLIMLFIIFLSNTGIAGQIAENKARYESLVYQYENNLYDNDNDLGKRELMTDIQNWNEDLARNKENQDNLWMGIFIPNIYDQFEFIELK